MWNDNDTNIDCIDFSHLVASVKSIIDNDGLLPCTIGLYGDWGSGKSSLMRMVEDQYENHEDVLTVKFNGWLFEGFDDAKSVLMGTILDEIITNRNLSPKGKSLVKKLLKKVDWMKVATAGLKSGLGFLALGPLGLTLGSADGADVLQKLSEVDYDALLKKDDNDAPKALRMEIREFHQDFSDLLAETEIKRLIVFIDDLDRCNPATVIDTLEAIKLFLFVENSAFVIGADERLIKYAVRQRFPEITGPERFDVGRDYLEKLVQFPVRIPQLSQSEMDVYVNLLFTKLSVSEPEHYEAIRGKVIEQKTMNPFDSNYNLGSLDDIASTLSIPPEDLQRTRTDLALSSAITPILTQELFGNPRQTKRFLNTLLMRLAMAKGRGIDLDKQVLAKLMVFEYFKTQTFKTISDHQAREEGRPKIIEDVEKFLKADANDDETPKIDGIALNWIEDEQTKSWLKMRPDLSSTDLRPYFYFSRDRLGTLPNVVKRMSPNAQKIFSQLLSKSEAERDKALDDFKTLSPADGSSIFDAISNDAMRRLGAEEGEILLSLIIAVSGARIELQPELFTFLFKIPAKHITATMLLDMENAIGGSIHKGKLIRYLEKLSEQKDNTMIAQMASKRLVSLKR